MGLLKCAYRSVRNFLIFFSIVAFLPYLPPKLTFDVTSYSANKVRPLTGSLALNTVLNGAERWLDGRVHGPEAIIVKGNDVYVSVVDEIVKLNGEHITHVATFGKPCDVSYEPHVCGRPLGIAWDTISENLIAADAYHGIFSVDVNTGKKTQLISPDQILPGDVERKAKIFNTVVVSKSGDIFWTDSSSDFDLANGLSSMFANPSGRLFHYNRATKTNKILVDRLLFANGIALSPNEDFVVVAETGMSRLVRVYLKGPLAGTSDVYVDGLPGFPDNLTPDSDGIWVPLVMSRDSAHPALWLSASEAPYIRKFIIRLVDLIEQPFRFFDRIYPNIFAKRALFHIGNFAALKGMAAERGTIVRVNWNGEIVGSLHGTGANSRHIAHVKEFKGKLLLGSFINDFISTIPVPANLRPAPSTTTTTTPKPSTTTTTTPRPTTTTTTTTPRPTTTTTTRAPTTTTAAPTTTTTTTAKPTAKAVPTTTTPKPVAAKPITTEKPAQTPKDPAPIVEIDPKDPKTPKPEKLKVIRKGGEQGEF